MPNYSIDWDEENSPRSFVLCWAISQSFLLLSYLLFKLHTLPTMALEAPGNPAWMRLLGVVEFSSCMMALAFSVQLIANSILHRTANTLESEEKPNSTPAVFGASLKMLSTVGRVQMRDQIQWNRILLASGGMATIAASFVLMFP